MKCQKCGKNEVIFHYSSNVNGCVTETHLCSDCAIESGYDINKMFELESFGGIQSVFDALLPMRSNISGFIPMAIPMFQTNPMLPFGMRNRRGTPEAGETCSCGCGQSIGQNVFKNTNVKVDEIMSKRRELSAEMQAAVLNEEFEKAAELRDKIKALESASKEEVTTPGVAERNEKCDSEITSQDSPHAQ